MLKMLVIPVATITPCFCVVNNKRRRTRLQPHWRGAIQPGLAKSYTAKLKIRLWGIFVKKPLVEQTRTKVCGGVPTLKLETCISEKSEVVSNKVNRRCASRYPPSQRSLGG